MKIKQRRVKQLNLNANTPVNLTRGYIIDTDTSNTITGQPVLSADSRYNQDEPHIVFYGHIKDSIYYTIVYGVVTFRRVITSDDSSFWKIHEYNVKYLLDNLELVYTAIENLIKVQNVSVTLGSVWNKIEEHFIEHPEYVRDGERTYKHIKSGCAVNFADVNVGCGVKINVRHNSIL